MKKFYIIIILLAGFSCVNAQQLPLENQYMVNKFALSPTYAGYTGNFESFFSYRKSWMGVEGAPERKTISVNGPIMRNMGIGGSMIMESAGIFNTLSANLSYAFRIKLTDVQNITFGAYAGVFENHIAVPSGNSQSELDPVAMENQLMRGSSFDAGAGILYSFKQLNVGISVPRLVPGSIKGEDNTLYTMQNHFRIHASYAYNVTTDIQVEPFVVINKTMVSPLMYEVAAMLKYKRQFWLGATYRKTGMGISLGAAYSRFALHYSYEIAGAGIAGQGSGTHEITVGMLIGKNKANPERGSIFKPAADQPYHQWTK